MTKKKTVDPNAETAFEIEKYADQYLVCRTIAHAWRIKKKGVASHLTFEIGLECLNCKARRDDTVSRLTGELMNRSYTYPDSYRHHGRTPKTDYRLEMVNRSAG